MIRFFQKEIAENLVKENGKTMADAEGDVLRGLRKSFGRDVKFEPRNEFQKPLKYFQGKSIV